MNDFEGLLSNDYGFKPQGKSAPMKPTNNNSSKTPFDFDIGSSKHQPSSIFDDPKPPSSKSINNDINLGDFDSYFGGSLSKSKSSNINHHHHTNNSNSSFDDFFSGGGGGGSGSNDSGGPKFSSLPVFDKPVYDDEDGDGPSSAKFENIFSSNSNDNVGSSSSKGKKGGDAFDDLLGGLGKKEKESHSNVNVKVSQKGVGDFDDLLPGFGGTTSAASNNRNFSDVGKKHSRAIDDPFAVLESTSPPVPSSSGIFSDPLEEIGNLNTSGRKHVERPTSGGVFDDIDPLDGFGKSAPPFSAEANAREKNESPLRGGQRASGRQASAGGDVSHKSSVRSPDRGPEKKIPVEDYRESPHSVFEMPSASTDSHRPVRSASPPSYESSSFRESKSHGHAPVHSDENAGSFDEVWLTVSEIPLFTQPTAAPPPARPPPPRPARFAKAESGSFPASNLQNRGSEYSSFSSSASYFQSPKSAPAGARGSFASPIDELEDFAMGKNQNVVDENADVPSGEDFDNNSVAAASAAAMKEAMDRAEAKFRHARGVRERENARASRSRESVQSEEKAGQDAQEREFREQQGRLERERLQREKEEEERRHREEEERRRMEREREEKEREKRRIERERELARHAVERVAKEARERAAAEARSRAERNVVQKVQAEARERAERAAVQRAQAEARERAAAEAKERAERAAAEAREKARAEAREKEAREKAAAAARENQHKKDNDLDSFFNMGRASSAPRPRAPSSGPFDTNPQSKPAPEPTRSSVNSSANMKKASSVNILDGLDSVFGGPPSAGVFQEIDGESDERRKARMERMQRVNERARRALDEKNQRDLAAQNEQAEKSRIGETLDVEIKRWSAGKEGNLRALLSTLQYVLWPECGWQPVSLTDLITAASVKKVYRKANLCIHPDKVQQKGANLQQRYIAEKVFDLLQEAWNKFNSEELF